MNTVTIPDRYPLPNIADFSSRIAGSTVFSKLDLQKGYYQVPMAEEDICKTAIITPFGMFEFLRLPFGLRNTGNTFQRMMDSILGNLPYCFTYVDDILIFSSSLEQHVDHLHEVLLLYRQHGLTIGLPKCEFAVLEIEFLGHLVSATGCSPLVKHTTAVSQFPVPADKPALQRFLGMLNFYRKFLRGAARVLAPLTNALKGPGKTLTWTPDLEAAFRHAKDLLIKVHELTYPRPSALISIAVDASDSHVGAMLQQKIQDAWAPLSFFSRKLSEAEKKYSAFNRELLAAYLSIRHFRFMLEGRDFLLYTDHKPLTSALFRSSPPWMSRQQRHLAYIAEFTSSIVHVPGLENIVADALSRTSPAPIQSSPLSSPPPHSEPAPPPPRPSPVSSPPPRSKTAPPLLQPFQPSHNAPCPSPTEDPASEVSAVTAVLALSDSSPSSSTTVHPSSNQDFEVPGFDFSKFLSAQKSCASVTAMKSSSTLSVVTVKQSDRDLLCDNSTGKLRPLVPEVLRKSLFNALHISNPGIRGSWRLISARFVWPGLSRDVGVWARACLQCQRSKVQTHVKSSIPAISVPSRRFSHVHIDIVGPLPSSQDCSYILTMIDRTTH